jgi:anti-sigma regulatory factor (Ser/Thr protein kinase)
MPAPGGVEQAAAAEPRRLRHRAASDQPGDTAAGAAATTQVNGRATDVAGCAQSPRRFATLCGCDYARCWKRNGPVPVRPFLAPERAGCRGVPHLPDRCRAARRFRRSTPVLAPSELVSAGARRGGGDAPSVTMRADFPRDPASVAAARHFVSGALDGLTAEKRQVVELMVSELATNAVVHARSSFSVEVRRRPDGSVHVEIADQGSGHPTQRHPSPLDAHGRGLLIVDAFADEWGTFECASGKSVWFSSSPDPGRRGARATSSVDAPPSVDSVDARPCRLTCRPIDR